MFANTIYLHDAGKINPYMQYDRLSNEKILKEGVPNLTALNTDHSPLSALIYIDIFYPKTKELDKKHERDFTQYLLICFAFVMSCHHGNLYNMEDWLEKIEKTKGEIVAKEGYCHFYKKKIDFKFNPEFVFSYVKKNSIDFDGYLIYILTKLLQSLLTSCDYISTYQYFNRIKDTKIDLRLINNVPEIFNVYKESDIYKKTMEYKYNPLSAGISPINKLRSKMFLEAEDVLLKHIDSNIFYLEKPTGAGKTNSSINLGFHLLEKTSHDKLLYIFPFNTLSDQTSRTLKNTFGEAMEIEVINSTTPIKSRHYDTGDIDYNRSLLDRQLWNYQSICTSHVNLFNTLFGTGRESSMSLFQLCNSVIILDEIQSYNNNIWRETIEFLYRYSELLNIKIIIMSATLPDLEKLVGFENERFVRLIKNRDEYFKSKEFANRVEIDTSLIKEKITHSILLNKVVKEIESRNELLRNDKSYKDNIFSMALVTFINKSTAQDFYEYTINKLKGTHYKILELDGDSPSYQRESILDIVKSNKEEDIILITTQLIEAGVDIDMDLGFKDKAIFDSEEQFIGRINRSCSKQYCKVFFFDLDDESKVYDGDLRLGLGIDNPKYLEMFKTKDFNSFYNEIINIIKIKKAKFDKVNSIKEFYQSLKLLEFDNISNHMKLIDTSTIQVFLPSNITYKKKNSDGVEVEYKVDGRKAWKEFVELLEDTSYGYSEKRIRIMDLMEDLSLFTYQLYGRGILGLESIGGMYYIENGETFITNGKIDKKKFKERYLIEK